MLLRTSRHWQARMVDARAAGGVVAVKAALARAVLGMEVALVEAEGAADARVKMGAGDGSSG